MTCKKGFTEVTAEMLAQSVTAALGSVADDIRDVGVMLGQNPYIVRIIRTRWGGNRRGEETETIVSTTTILPTPKIRDWSSVQQMFMETGSTENGVVRVSEISTRYTEEELRGWSLDGTPPAKNEQVFYEVEYPQQSGGAIKRRFVLRGIPEYDAGNVQWYVNLERSHADRSRDGELYS